MKFENAFLVFFLLLALTAQDASSFGLASSYLENNTMILFPGETREYKVELQNVDSSEIRAKFVLESNITKVIDEKEFYIVGNKTQVLPIMLSITAPESAKPGETFEVRYGAYPLGSQDSQVSLNIRFNRAFTVRIEGEPQIKDTGSRNLVFPLVLIVGILLILGIVITLIEKKSSMLSKKILNMPKKEAKAKRAKK
jgi:hypothetical protein